MAGKSKSDREARKARDLDRELNKALASGRAKRGVWKRLKTKHGIGAAWIASKP